MTNGLEEDLVAGMKAFAKLWFLEHTDETELPSEYYRLMDLVEQWLHADTSDLEDEDEDEDDR